MIYGLLTYFFDRIDNKEYVIKTIFDLMSKCGY